MNPLTEDEADELSQLREYQKDKLRWMSQTEYYRLKELARKQLGNASPFEALSPPLGITPKFIWDNQRLQDLNEAILRYYKAEIPIPEEWIIERNVLIVNNQLPMTRYPKKHIHEFIQFAENDCRQVNLHMGLKYNYWFVEPNTKPYKLAKGQIPDVLNGKDIGILASN